jgi:hypothetical protein
LSNSGNDSDVRVAGPGERKAVDVDPQLPAQVLPIVRGGLVGFEHVNVAFVNAQRLQRQQATLDQRLADAREPASRN